ncbi:ATP-binding protein [Nocardioides sp. CPCC 205120]|uniref:ATP-binding protein n=1 Tax=Nocardioides sp. CPCC 205120 TaxID=3406462 RepID=UPI003B5041C2
MPQSRDAVRLDPGPSSVQHARRWAAAACREMGREDLVEAAELCVSELVTNAVLHAEPPISLRVRGTREHPRLEVFDGSHQPPVFTPMAEGDVDDELDLLLTVGRGLGMVAMNSAAWGADITPEGKVVWFEPVAEPRLDGDLAGEVYDVTTAPSAPDADDRYVVHLAGLPAAAYRDFRRHYSDLRREVRLLALAHEDAYPLARDLSRLFDTFERQIDHAAAAAGVEATLAAGHDRVDVDLTVGEPAGGLAEQMLELLDLADAFCRAQRLLSLERSAAQRAFQQWLLSEVARQGRGEQPAAWAAAAADRVDGVHAS